MTRRRIAKNPASCMKLYRVENFDWMNKDTKYLQFPVCWIRDLFTDRIKTLNNIIAVGTYRFSRSVKFDESLALKQILFDWYRHRDWLTSSLASQLSDLYDSGVLCLDDDYNGFAGDEFIPEELDDLINYTEGNPGLLDEAMDYFRIHCAYYTLDVRGNKGGILIAGRELADIIPDKHPWVMINKDLVFDYRDNAKEPWEIEQLAAYLGITSILGKKPYCKTNKHHILARMFGFVSYNDIPPEPDPIIRDLMGKYFTADLTAKRYPTDKLLQQLELKWNLKFYGNHLRGIMIGNKKASLEAMALAAEKKKQSNKLAELKQRKLKAYKEAVQQLNKDEQLK
jgi:hypothetical protein